MKKNLIFLISVSFFAAIIYGGWAFGLAGWSLAFAGSEAPVVPEACKSSEKEFEDTCYSDNNAPYLKQVNALKKIKACLKGEGFSEDKIKKTLILIKENAGKRKNNELSQN